MDFQVILHSGWPHIDGTALSAESARCLSVGDAVAHTCVRSLIPSIRGHWFNLNIEEVVSSTTSRLYTTKNKAFP